MTDLASKTVTAAEVRASVEWLANHACWHEAGDFTAWCQHSLVLLAAADHLESVHETSGDVRALFNKGLGVLKENRFSFSFENAEEAERAFHYIADLGTLQTSKPPRNALKRCPRCKCMPGACECPPEKASAEPMAGPYCPETNAPCDRMCQSTCHRRAESGEPS